MLIPASQYAVGDGVTDDHSVLQSLLNDGHILSLDGKTYRNSSTLDITVSGSGIIGPGKIYMRAADFNNTTLGAWGSNAVGIHIRGSVAPPFARIKDIILDGFSLESEQSNGRSVRGIAARLVNNFRCRNVEVFGFPVGPAISCDSITGEIVGCHVHDCGDDTAWSGQPQITGIECDNNVLDTTSDGLSISHNRIERLTVGPTFLAAHGYQTDGISVLGSTSDVRVIGNYISDVGEGVDFYGAKSVIADNIIRRAHYFGVKLIHGANRAIVENNSIFGSGLAGITLEASTQVSTHADYDVIEGNTIGDTDPDGTFAANDTACIRLGPDNGATSFVRYALVARNALILNAAKYYVLNSSSQMNNLIESNYQH